MKSNRFFTSTGLPVRLTIIMSLTIQFCIAQQKNIPMNKVYDVIWTHSHEEREGNIEVYRPDSYQFPPSRGRRGFKMLEDKSFINYEIAPTDGIVERKGRWEKENDYTFAVSFGENEKNRNYKLEFVSYKKNRLKLKIIQN